MNTIQLIVILCIFSLLSAYFYKLIDIKYHINEDAGSTIVAEREDNFLTEFSRKLHFKSNGVLAGFLCVPIAFLSLIIYFLFDTSFQRFNAGWDSKTWTPIQALVTESERIGSQAKLRGDGHYASLSSTGIRYEFYVKGELKAGTRIDYGTKIFHGDSEKVKKAQKKLPKVGEEIQIYYDEKTGRSVLYPGLKITGLPIHLFGIFMFCCNAFLVAMFFSMLRVSLL